MSESNAAVPFPREPVRPALFFERYLAKWAARLRLPAAGAAIDFSLGYSIPGEQGGEWVLRLAGGALEVCSESRGRCGISLIQSAGDFEQALWGEPAAPLRARIRSEWPETRVGPGDAVALASRAARVLAELSGLDALVRLRITGVADGVWTLDARLGSGAVPREPDATITLPIDVAEALLAGRVRPLDALLRIQIDGDYGLLLAAYGALKSAGA